MTLFYQEFSKILILLFFSIFLASLILFLSFRLSTYNPDVEKVSANISKLNKIYKPKKITNVDVGIKKFIDWYKNYY